MPAAIRSLLRVPTFTLPAVAGLAFAIGAATAVFSAVHTVLLRSMGVASPDRVVTLWHTDLQRGQKHVEVAFGDYQEWAKRTDLFAGVALVSSVNLDFPILGDGNPQQLQGTTVTGRFFDMLGVRPAAGRLLASEDDRAGMPVRIVISHRLWRSRWGADPKLIGRTVRAGGDDSGVTVIGVAPPDFDLPRDVDIWVALHAGWPDVEKQADLRVFRGIARLRDDVSPTAAQAALDVLAKQLEPTRKPGSGNEALLVTPLLDEVFGNARRALWLLFGAVTLVLLIACANAAHLLLARGMVRRRELAVRAVLGAGRARLVFEQLAESAVLAAAACAAGVLLAVLGVRLLARLAPADVPRLSEMAVNAPVLLFAVAIAAASVLSFGLAPALTLARRDPNSDLHEAGARVAGSRSHSRARGALIGAEVALSLVLLVSAGLLVRSFNALAAVDPGFRPERVATFRVTLNSGDQEKRRQFFSRVEERMRALPGVESAAAVLIRPLSGLVGWDTVYLAEGQSPTDQTLNPNANYEAVGPGYFRTIGIRVLAGRDFTAADVHTAPGVVVINESTARRHFGGVNAVGRHVRLGADPKAPWLTVVGVVNDVHYREWEAARPDFYVPYTQRAQHRSDFVVKTSGDPGAMLETIRKTVLEVDPNQPVSNLTTMEALVDATLARARFNSVVLTVLAGCAAVLALCGVYAVLSYMVAQRTGEFGIRMALGATQGRIVRLVLNDVAPVLAAGTTAGLALAGVSTYVLRDLLFAVHPADARAWAGATAALAGVAVLACAVPVLRAALVAPMRALRTE